MVTFIRRSHLFFNNVRREYYSQSLYLQPQTKFLSYNDQQKKYPDKGHADSLHARGAGADG
jgi:hypothetical protein